MCVCVCSCTEDDYSAHLLEQINWWWKARGVLTLRMENESDINGVIKLNIILIEGSDFMKIKPHDTIPFIIFTLRI